MLYNCSQIGGVISEPKTNKDKEAGLLSKTSQSYIKELWRRNKYGRKETATSKYTEKGILTEDKCISMLTRKTGKLFFKNTVRKEDQYLTGECDVEPEGESPDEMTIYDAKSCWSLKTFMDAELTSRYEWQGRGYMRLWNVSNFKLVYFLVNAPEHLIESEIRRKTWDCQTPEEYKEIEDQTRRNMTFDDIPEELRVKEFHVKRCFDKEAFMIRQIIKAQKYYNELTL